MAKYLTEFDTYAQYSGATLSLPNVSLIKATGEVYYKNVFAGATLGDVLMYDIANDKLVTSFGGIWSAEAFPIASYTPIAVNVYPGSQTPDGKNRYMAIRWLLIGSTTGGSSGNYYKWGPNNFAPSTDTEAFNGRSNQDAAELVMPGTTGNTQAEYAAFYACSIFAAPGTNAGDWYLPSRKELSLYSANYSTINGIIEAIKTAAGSSYISTIKGPIYSSTTYGSGTGSVYSLLESNGSIITDSKGSDYTYCRAMISI